MSRKPNKRRRRKPAFRDAEYCQLARDIIGMVRRYRREIKTKSPPQTSHLPPHHD